MWKKIIVFAVMILILTGCQQDKPAVVSKPLPPILSNMDEDSFYYFADGTRVFGSNYSAFINRDGQVIASFYDAVIDLTSGRINKKTEPVIIGISDFESIKNLDAPGVHENGNYKYGLYGLDQNKWLIECKYSEFDLCEGFLKAPPKERIYRVYDSKKGIALLNYKGEDLSRLWNIKGGVDSFYVNGFIWIKTNGGKSYSVYRPTGELINKIDSNYLYPNDKYVQGRYKVKGVFSDMIWNQDGTRAFNVDKFYKNDSQSGQPLETELFISDFNDISKLLSIYLGDIQFIVDLEGNIIKKTTEKNSETVLMVTSVGYSVTDNDGLRFYNRDNSPMKTNENEEFTDYEYPNKYYKRGDIFTVYDADKKVTYDYPGGNNFYLRMDQELPDYYVMVKEQGQGKLNVYSVYYKDKLILSKEAIDVLPLNGFLEVILPIKTTDTTNWLDPMDYDEYSQYMTGYQEIYNDKGDLFYRSETQEAILGLDKEYFLVKRGNYLGITSNNGEFIYKIIDPESGQD